MSSASDERISDHKVVARLLKRIMDRRALLTITLADSIDTYNSAILELDERSRSLTLDELKPLSGHDRLMAQGRLRARAALQGVEIRFSAQLLDAVKESGIWMYHFHMPNELQYRQRRANYRIPVGMSSGVSVELHKDGLELAGLRVLDVSEGGLGLRTQSPISLNLGDRLPCTLNLPNGRSIRCQLEVRNLRETPQAYGSMQVGGHFLDLDRPQRTALSRVLIELQRDMIRRSPKN